MAKISAKKSNIKTIANRISVSPNTEVVADLKFKRKQDFRKFLKWVSASSKALERVELPKKKEIEKLVKDSGRGGGFPWLLALLGLGAAGLGAAAALSKGKGEERTGLAKGIETASSSTGRIPKNVKIPTFKKINVKSGGPRKVKVTPKSNTLKLLQKGRPPKVTNVGSRVKVIRNLPGTTGVVGYETGKGKLVTTKAKAPSIPKKLEVSKKIVENKGVLKNIKLNKGLVGVTRGALNVAGKGIAVAGGAMSTMDRLQEGQTVTQSLVGATGETLGAWYGFAPGFKIGAAITAKAASALIFAPFPGARILYGGAVLFGGISGGILTSNIGKKLGGGIADKITGVQKKMSNIEKKKTVKDKKEPVNSKEPTVVPFPVINSQPISANQSQVVPVPITNNSPEVSADFSSASMDNSGVNSTWETLLLSRL